MTPFEKAVITYLSGIDASMKTLAAYADYLHQTAVGFKKVHVTAYVRGRNAGGDLVHFYTDHPKVTKRVGRVYAERFAELPFDTSKGKLHEGEQAPSRDWAAANGYLNPVTPFDAIFIPSGKTTDAGLPVFKFSHVLPAAPAAPTPPSVGELADDTYWCEWCGDAPSIPGVPCSRCATLGAQPDDAPTPPSLSTDAPSIPPSPSQPAHPQPATRITRVPPLAPEALRQWIQHKIAEYTVQRRVATESQVGHVHTALTATIPDEATRRRFQEWLIGFPSMKEWSRSQVLALHGWLKPSAKNGPTDPFVPEEIAQALAFLSDYVPHPLFVTAQDAIDWAVTQGAFPNPGVAGAAYTARWIEWHRPSFEDMLSRWADYIPTLIPS